MTDEITPDDRAANLNLICAACGASFETRRRKKFCCEVCRYHAYQPKRNQLKRARGRKSSGDRLAQGQRFRERWKEKLAKAAAYDALMARFTQL